MSRQIVIWAVSFKLVGRRLVNSRNRTLNFNGISSWSIWMGKFPKMGFANYREERAPLWLNKLWRIVFCPYFGRNFKVVFFMIPKIFCTLCKFWKKIATVFIFMILNIYWTFYPFCRRKKMYLPEPLTFFCKSRKSKISSRNHFV